MSIDLLTPDIPILSASKKYPQSNIYFLQLSLYLKIIRERINKNEKKYKENFQNNQHLQNIALPVKIALDIKSFYSFTQDYLNYLVIFLHDNYFSCSTHFNTKTLKNHYNSLETTECITEQEKFRDYKKILRKYAPILLEKISEVRDSMIVHRKSKFDEFFSYNPSTGKASTTFVKPFKKKPKNPEYIISNNIDDLYKLLINFIKEIKSIID